MEPVTKTQEEKFLEILYFYLDFNNQHCKAMRKYLSFKNFQWIENFAMIDFLNILHDSPDVILEVDLKYPEHLNDSHKAFSKSTLYPKTQNVRSQN